jgi:cell wall-associated NlpC family hydrolase
MQAKGVVIRCVVNLYREASLTADVVTQAILGTDLAIMEILDGWYYVRMPDQYQGWIESTHVLPWAAGQALYATTGPVAEIRNLFAFVYREPSVTAHAPVLQVTISTRLEVAAEQEEWVQVALPDRAQYWVQKGDVSLSAAEAAAARPRGSAEAVIATAKRFLGLPYLWGGTTPRGVDCSGFVQLVYRLNGVSLLRDADMQYTQPGLPPVSQAELQAGDLLFFGTSSITHVGMYIGGGEFIHATTHGQPIVQISRLDEPHWTGLFQGARRP